MGLSKELNTGTGITLTYFNIRSAMFKYKQGTVNVNIAGYINKDIRDSEEENNTDFFGIDIIDDKSEWDTTEYLELSGVKNYTSQNTISDIRQSLYNQIKTIPFWSDAEDC